MFILQNMQEQIKSLLEIVPIFVQLQEVFIRKQASIGKYLESFHMKFNKINFKQYNIQIHISQKSIKQQLSELRQLNFSHHQQSTLELHNKLSFVANSLYSFQLQQHDEAAKQMRQLQKTKSALRSCIAQAVSSIKNAENKQQATSNVLQTLRYFYDIEVVPSAYADPDEEEINNIQVL